MTGCAMKRFLLFTGWDDSPAGGWGDYHSNHDTSDTARAAAFDESLFYALRVGGTRWFEIVDLDTGSIVDQGDGIASIRNIPAND